MNKTKRFILKDYIALTIYAIVSIVSIVLDLCFFDISLKHIDTLVITCFSSLISISGIWVGCYLLFLELFRDRYQLNLLKSNYHNSMKRTFFSVVYCVIFGILIMSFSLEAISSISFCLMTSYTIVEIFIKIFASNKSLMITSHINKLEKDLEKKLESGCTLSSNDIKDYRYLFDECVVKEEYFTIQNMVENGGQLFRTFLKNCIGKTTIDNLEKSFETILKFNCIQLDLCKSINSNLLLTKIAIQQYENLKFCIDNLQTEWYKRYLNDIKFYLTFKKETTASQNEIASNLFYMMHKIVLYLIENNNDSLAEHTLDTIQTHISKYRFVHKDAELKNFASYNYHLLNKCQEIGNEKWFIKISENLKEFPKSINFKDVKFNTYKSYYALIFNYFCKNDKNKALLFCESTIKTFDYDINSYEFSSFKYYCINELYSLSENDEQFKEKVYTLHIEILNRSLSAQNKPDIIVIPDLNEIILSSNYDKEKYERNIDKFQSILNTCIIENEATHFYKFLRCINDVIVKTESRQKDIQILLLNVYFWSIYRSRNLANRNFYKISFELLEQAIIDLDKERVISDNLGKFIINEISEFAKKTNYDNSEIIISSINLLSEFIEDGKSLFFIINSPERKKQLYRSLYCIGTDCIENSYEEGIRRISNAIGWAIISCIKHSSIDHAYYLIDRAIDLYELSIKMDFSKATQVFIATLFTTIGAYCSKNHNLYNYRKRIIEKSTITLDILKIAAKIRTSESEIWNDLLDNKPEELTSIFLAEYKKKHS